MYKFYAFQFYVEKKFCSTKWCGGGGWGGLTPPTSLHYVWPCIKVAEVVKQPASTITTTEQKRGGFTCCIPLRYNNSKVNKGLCFYVIPKEAVLRKK